VYYELKPVVGATRPQVEAWIRQAKDGSNDAAGKLIDACRNYLLSIANQELPPVLRAKLGASDLVQDTALEAQRDFAAFEGEQLEQLLGWLRRILLNNAANVSRQYRQTEKRDVARELPLDSRGAEGVMDDQRSPSSLVDSAEERQRVERCLDRLPEDMRAAITLRNRDDLSFCEIGIQLDRSPEAARKLWARAIERLQQELQNESLERR